MTEENAVKRARRQEKVGIVVSDKMDKTVVVAVATTKMHRLYLRFYRKTTKFHAHDAKNECREGDRVRLVASRRNTNFAYFAIALAIGYPAQGLLAIIGRVAQRSPISSGPVWLGETRSRLKSRRYIFLQMQSEHRVHKSIR